VIVQIVLAAGAGVRLGGPKGALRLGGRSLVARALDARETSRVERSIVVVGADADRVAADAARPGTTVVRNDAWALGQTSSLQAGLRALPPEAEAFLVHPVDYALVDATALNAVADAFRDMPAAARATAIVRPRFGAGWGHPVLYARSYAADFLALAPSASAREVYRRRLDRVVPADVADDACLTDLDTPEDLAAARRRVGER